MVLVHWKEKQKNLLFACGLVTHSHDLYMEHTWHTLAQTRVNSLMHQGLYQELVSRPCPALCVFSVWLFSWFYLFRMRNGRCLQLFVRLNIVWTAAICVASLLWNLLICKWHCSRNVIRLTLALRKPAMLSDGKIIQEQTPEALTLHQGMVLSFPSFSLRIKKSI